MKHVGITLQPLIVEVDVDIGKTELVIIPANSKVSIKFIGNGLSNSEDFDEAQKLLNSSKLKGHVYGNLKQ